MPGRHLALGALVGLGLALVGVPPAAASPVPRPVNARVSAAFVMQGRIVTAVRVSGEHRGQRVTRRWTFTGRSCTRNICRQLRLTRERSAGQYDNLVLSRTGVGRYAGSGRFYVALECRGAAYPHGEVVPYRVTVEVTQAVGVQGTAFATALRATYTNLRRSDRTICPIGPSHDAAVYSGVASPPPSPPTAAFSAAVAPGTVTATFASTSTPGGDQSPIAAVLWRFGDSASGAADGATTPQATHTFSQPGTYTVSLSVTDANGLTSSQSQQIVVPAPPG
ncbi:MAG TPA: PKD domain-containing protein [Solirubrobacteraceae bacterium]|jgi:hypothetical protein|nr:PKD domain-containing protein [Solirubrobacteraceae bacterium]